MCDTGLCGIFKNCAFITIIVYGVCHVTFEMIQTIVPIGFILIGVFTLGLYVVKLPRPDEEIVQKIVGRYLTEEEEYPDELYIKTVAHRGAGLDAPENSLAAFDYCNKKGCTSIEFDVTLTADDVPVVFHDKTLERVAESNKIISSTAWEDLNKIDISVHHPFKERFPDTRIPTLHETVSQLLKADQHMYIDIKTSNGKIIDIILDLYQEYPSLHSMAVVTSFYPNIIYYIRRANPKIVCSLAWRPYCFTYHNYTALEGKGEKKSLNPFKHVFLCVCDILYEWFLPRLTHNILGISLILLHKDCISPKVVADWKSRGVRVVAWPIYKMKESEKQKDEKQSWKTLSFKEKYAYISSHITVEPMVACYIMPSVLASLATQNLNLEKACRVNLAYPVEVCDALTARSTLNYTKEEAAVQQLVASMAVWKTILQSALPAFLILFIGAWSDRSGLRKPCMLMPIVGEFCTIIGLMTCTYFFYELPMEVCAIVEALFPALTGGWFTMFMGVFSYIADVTTVEMRTLRIGFVNVFCSVGIPIGMALSGILYKKIGFYGVFSVSGILYIVAFVYGYFKIEETPRENATGKLKSRCSFFKEFFDWNHILDTMKVAFKQGENNRRIKIMMLMLVVMVVIGPMHGEMVVIYLFTRFRFNWDEVDFSIFSTYNMVIGMIGTSVSVGLFSHFLKIDDAIIGVMSSASKILSSFVYTFATVAWVFYLGPIVEILNGTSFIAMRSIASKLVPTDELGKINSLIGVSEALMPLVYGPLYSATYASSMNTMPGAFFLLGGCLTVPACVIFGWMYLQHKKDAIRAEASKLAIENGTMDKKATTTGIDNAAFEIETQKI
ncbi:hypothetical protein FQR65_LT05619 [Abscondita terminalis]|nr:hypothetical protein FQR65_LT05619 [Abscondita terminalis]